jgi:Zn-dependent protease with chaperone function
MLRLLRLIAVLTVIPLLGIAVTIARYQDSAGGLEGAVSGSLSCAGAILSDARGYACGEATPFGWLSIVSTGVLVLSFAIVPLSRIVAALLGSNRTILSLGFWPYALITTLVVGVVSLVHFGIFASGVYLALGYWLAFQSDLLIGAFGVIGLGAAYAVIRGLGVFFTRPKSYVAARPISFYEYPRLGLMVRDVSKTLQAKMPDNVIIGLEPTFFATSAPVHTPYGKGPLQGQTLHLSLPLMSHFTEGELRAVIGHELGHFSGGDTAYTIRFAPVYMGLAKASEVFSARGRPITRLLSLPSKFLIDDLIYAFSVVERRIGRQREHRADQHGAQVSSPEDIAYSLLKSSLLGSMWGSQMEGVVTRGMQGRFSRNIVRSFSESVRLDVDRARIAPLLEFALGDSVRHPIDTHPPTEDRLAAFGLNLGAICAEDTVLHRFYGAPKVTDGLDNMTALEEDLTALQYHLMSEMWPKEQSAEQGIDEIFGYLLTDFLALMVTIDASVDDREIVIAETRAMELFGGLDREGVRERCRHPGDIPSLDRMISFANKLLNEHGIANLKTVLRQIAEADGEIAEKEAQLLALLEANLRPEDPPEEES